MIILYVIHVYSHVTNVHLLLPVQLVLQVHTFIQHQVHACLHVLLIHSIKQIHQMSVYHVHLPVKPVQLLHSVLVA